MTKLTHKDVTDVADISKDLFKLILQYLPFDKTFFSIFFISNDETERLSNTFDSLAITLSNNNALIGEIL